MRRWGAPVLLGFLGGCSLAALAGPLPADAPGAMLEAARLDRLPAVAAAPTGHPARHIDHSGRTETGRASYYAHRFSHRKMADGQPMNPNANVAASKDLPLGSVAKVTNLENGKTATVRIEDRGPQAPGRVVDLAPSVATQLDLHDAGVARVEVKPITLPRPDGQVELGAGAAETSPQDVREAVEVTKQLTGATANR